MKYYAVKKGRRPGIYTTWTECQEQVKGYSGAVFKSFLSAEEAEEYLHETAEEMPVNDKLPFAFIDGSYKQSTGFYGWGGFIDDHCSRYIIQGKGNNPNYAKERNIAGEIIGAAQIAFKALQLGISELNLYYDYAGVEHWITGNWKAKTELANYYRSTLLILENDIKLHFVKVKGHAGIDGNEIADCLANEAIGAKLRKKDMAMLEEFKARANAS